MKKILFIISLFVFFLFLIFILYLTVPKEKNSQLIVSPVPSFLSILQNREVSSLSLFLPSLENKIFAKFSTPEISAESALVYDFTSKKVLYEKNPKEHLPMASLTKIMTAIVAMEHPLKNDKYLVTQNALVGEDSMGLTAGEVLSLKELLYGLILHSGNDAAETLANNYPSGRAAFINAMNDKVKSLGLSNTHFTNPSGLEGDGSQYTTSYDFLVITSFAIFNFPEFLEVSKTFDQTLEATSTHKEYFLENETNLISSYPGVKGVKTGYTPEAGYCLVTYLDYGGHKIMAILLNSQNRRQEMKDLLDYSLKSVGVTPPQHG